MRRARGFTILEMMVVILIIMVLLGMAAGMYQRSIVKAREATLKQDLATMRNAIEQFAVDKLQGAQSLDELVSAGYLRQVPTDPITNQKDWRVEMCDMMLSVDQTAPGICDVKSSAQGVSTFEGTPYSSW